MMRFLPTYFYPAYDLSSFGALARGEHAVFGRLLPQHLVDNLGTNPTVGFVGEGLGGYTSVWGWGGRLAVSVDRWKNDGAL